MAGKTEKTDISERINDFIQKRRKILIISLASVIVTVIVLVTVFTIRDHLHSQALSKVEEFNRRYEDIWYEDWDAFLLELNQFANRNNGYAAARAFAISANIYENQNNWAEAENAWVNAARAATGTYFSPVGFFNAAVAAEEQGNIDRAIELYTEALEYQNIFPAAPRTQFSIGRLQESQGNRAAALISYMTLVSRWPNDQVWASLAQSRIVLLSIGP